ncbi:MAG: FAD-dependent oxidoreductase, partial [Acidobacteria bacterium]|nr:FAD-dependent oxidoreductase [Acidobacteriota bacterium]
MPTLVPAEDAEIGTALAGYLREEGLKVRTGVSIGEVSRDHRGGYTVDVTTDGRVETFKAAQLLVATGRRANTRGFGLEDAGIELGKKGEIRVNEHLQTSQPHVYAAGDVIGDPMFVYVAAYAGNLAAENAINGNSRCYDLSALPRVTFTDPRVASVGLSEQEARTKGVDLMVSKLPLSYVPRALAAR